jgi:hypothetical protein
MGEYKNRARMNQHPPVHQRGWMDGALMGAPFSSLPVPGLTKVANSSLFFLSLAQVGVFLGTFFPHPPTPAQVSPTCLHLDYLPMHLGFLPPPPTYLHAHLPTHLSTYSPICLPSHQPTYLCTYALNLHQGNDNVGWWRYCNISSRLLRSPSYLPIY